jgi:hypothetical protein
MGNLISRTALFMRRLGQQFARASSMRLRPRYFAAAGAASAALACIT